MSHPELAEGIAVRPGGLIATDEKCRYEIPVFGVCMIEDGGELFLVWEGDRPNEDELITLKRYE